MLTSALAASPNRRSYHFLIDRLLPKHFLSETRRSRLEAALARNDRDRLFGETVEALLELDGHFEELPAPDPSFRVFRRRGTADSIRLEKPRSSMLQASRPSDVATGSVLDDGAVTQARDAGNFQTADREDDHTANAAFEASPGPLRPDSESLDFDLEEFEEGLVPAAEAQSAGDNSESAADVFERPATSPASAPKIQASAEVATVEPWSSLEPFFDLAGIEPELEPFGDRLRRIVQQVERALPGAQARLLCLRAEGAEGLGDGAVEVLERAAVEEMPHFREALRRGETQFATSAPVGSDPASGRIAAAVPIYVANEPWGLLQVTWAQGHAGSVAELARLLAPLARLVAVAIQNQTTLEKLVFLDPLTGVYNRAFYDRQVSLEIERANRTNQKFALLVMDVDDFKPVNDQYGHRAGDHVLSQMSREVRGRMRKIDLMFRYGGEEFVLLLPGADLEEAQRTAERLRLVVSEQRFRVEGTPTPLHVTVSIGGAVYPDQSRTKTGIFNAADAALYRAKHEGKNRVAF